MTIGRLLKCNLVVHTAGPRRFLVNRRQQNQRLGGRFQLLSGRATTCLITTVTSQTASRRWLLKMDQVTSQLALMTRTLTRCWSAACSSASTSPKEASRCTSKTPRTSRMRQIWERYRTCSPAKGCSATLTSNFLRRWSGTASSHLNALSSWPSAKCLPKSSNCSRPASASQVIDDKEFDILW